MGQERNGQERNRQEREGQERDRQERDRFGNNRREKQESGAVSRRFQLDEDWKFYRGDLAPHRPTDGWGGAKARAYSFGAAAQALDDSGWRSISLPHDFVVEGEPVRRSTGAADMQQIPEMESIDSRHFAAGSLETGVAWYRKHFTLREEEGRRIYLIFDGIQQESHIYLNEYFLGRGFSGSRSYCYDITDFVNLQGENLLAVRVDATGREGWWYEGGGIYRHVWLEIRENVHVARWGTFVNARVEPENRRAFLTLETEIVNVDVGEREVTVVNRILDRKGRILTVQQSCLRVSPFQEAICRQETVLTEVSLWEPENPYLYVMQTELLVEGRATDRTETTFGLRKMQFDAEEGFLLNGKKMQIRGLCFHNDHAGVGIALPDGLQEYRLRQICRMGGNAYRSAHHPPTPELLDACDRLGILVLDETRRMSSAGEDLDCLRAMVKRDRNHPCIFIWGIGNEEIFSQDRPETARTTQTMKREIHRLDPTRPVTAAVTCWNGQERFENAAGYVEVTKHLDVMGFNYCASAWADYHMRMPEQPILITEASSNSWTRGCYRTEEAAGQYFIYDEKNESKCRIGKKAVRQGMGEREWDYFTSLPYLSGIFLWTGMDYRGEPTPLSYPAIGSQFGIMDYCGFPKDNFYYYQAWWGKEPVLHLFPHWTHPGREGEKLSVYCYSNLEQVELFVNEKSYGRQTMSKNGYICWPEVIYEPGRLWAKGFSGGKTVLTEEVETAGAASQICVELYQGNCVEENTLPAGELAILNISIRDEKGNLVPDGDPELRFEVTGAGAFLGCGNGNPGSHESDKVPLRRAFYGRCQLLVKTLAEGEGAARVRVCVRASGLREAKVEIGVCGKP